MIISIFFVLYQFESEDDTTNDYAVYEMPVCDGRMTLEMIRAEEELCDIPVKEVLIQKIEEVFHKEQ